MLSEKKRILHNVLKFFILNLYICYGKIIERGDCMKIGMIPTGHIKTYGFEKGISKISEHGFECIDYQDFIRTDTEFFMLDKTLFEKELLRQRSVFEKEGLFVHQSHAPFRFPIQDGTPEDRAERLEVMKKAVYGTAVLGADTFVMHPLSPFTLECPDPAEETKKINADFIANLAGYAKEFGITVCVENLPFTYYSLSPCERLNEFVRALDLDNVKICFDIGHANYLAYVKTELGIGLADFVPQSIDDEVRRFGEKLGTCHIHQNYGDSDAHATLDDGNIDIKTFSNALFEIGYRGVYSLEVVLKFEKYPESEWDNVGRSLFETAKGFARR